MATEDFKKGPEYRFRKDGSGSITWNSRAEFDLLDMEEARTFAKEADQLLILPGALDITAGGVRLNGNQD